jgi:hypothetical protein
MKTPISASSMLTVCHTTGAWVPAKIVRQQRHTHASRALHCVHVDVEQMLLGHRRCIYVSSNRSADLRMHLLTCCARAAP